MLYDTDSKTYFSQLQYMLSVHYILNMFGVLHASESLTQTADLQRNNYAWA